MGLVLKKKVKPAGTGGDYPKKRTAKRTAAYVLANEIKDLLEKDGIFKDKERAAAKSMCGPIIARFNKICGVDDAV